MRITTDILAREIAADMDLSQADAKKVVNQVFEAIAENMEDQHEINIPGFGKFTAKTRQARKARNPATGEIIDVAAKTAPKFLPAKQLKERCNGET